jgi:membrane associated rhomboid family serine protease
MTYLLMVSICLVMSFEILLSQTTTNAQEFVNAFGLVSGDFSWTNPSSWLQLVTFNFLHSSSHHFVVNAYVMLIAGVAIERHCGPRAMLFVWLAGGMASGIVHLMVFPDTDRSLIGASGAICALLGAALVVGWHWGLPVRFRLGGRTYFRVRLPAVIGVYMALQVYGLFNMANSTLASTSVATWVHVGGFGFGVLAALALLVIRRTTSPAPVS